MPELPEVETVTRGLEGFIVNEAISRVTLTRPDLRVPFPENMQKILQGARVTACHRRAKYILIDFDNGQTLIIHLGMSGRIDLIEGSAGYNYRKHDHMGILFDGDKLMIFNDPRRFGMVYLTPTADWPNHKAFAKMGPEPLDPPLTGKVLTERLAGKSSPIKIALLDQRIVVGVGNIYACEALFQAGISPRRKADTIKGARADRLATAICDVLDRAIKAGGSTLKDYRHTDGQLGYFQHSFAVYDRAGDTCSKCAGEGREDACIKRTVQAGRSTFFCSRQQK